MWSCVCIIDLLVLAANRFANFKLPKLPKLPNGAPPRRAATPPNLFLSQVFSCHQPFNQSSVCFRAKFQRTFPKSQLRRPYSLPACLPYLNSPIPSGYGVCTHLPNTSPTALPINTFAQTLSHTYLPAQKAGFGVTSVVIVCERS